MPEQDEKQNEGQDEQGTGEAEPDREPTDSGPPPPPPPDNEIIQQSYDRTAGRANWEAREISEQRSQSDENNSTSSKDDKK